MRDHLQERRHGAHRGKECCRRTHAAARGETARAESHGGAGRGLANSPDSVGSLQSNAVRTTRARAVSLGKADRRRARSSVSEEVLK